MGHEHLAWTLARVHISKREKIMSLFSRYFCLSLCLSLWGFNWKNLSYFINETFHNKKKAMPVMKSSSNIQSNLLLHFVNSQEEFKVEIWTEVVRKWKSLQLVQLQLQFSCWGHQQLVFYCHVLSSGVDTNEILHFDSQTRRLNGKRKFLYINPMLINEMEATFYFM